MRSRNNNNNRDLCSAQTVKVYDSTRRLQHQNSPMKLFSTRARARAHAHTHTHTHTHTHHTMHTHARALTQVRAHDHWGKYVRETRVEGYKHCWKRWVFKACLNDVWESEWRRQYGRPFQLEGPTCENDLWPNALELERGILRMRVSAEEQRSLEGVYRWRS